MQVVFSKIIPTQFFFSKISGLVESGLDHETKEIYGPRNTHNLPDLARLVEEDGSGCDESAVVGGDVWVLMGVCGDQDVIGHCESVESLKECIIK